MTAAAPAPPRRPPPARPPRASPRTGASSARSASSSTPRGGPQQKALSARAKLWGPPQDTSVANSILRRADLNCYLYDVQAEAREAEKAAQAAESEALNLALERSQERARALEHANYQHFQESAVEAAELAASRAACGMYGTVRTTMHRPPPSVTWADESVLEGGAPPPPSPACGMSPAMAREVGPSAPASSEQQQPQPTIYRPLSAGPIAGVAPPSHRRAPGRVAARGQAAASSTQARLAYYQGALFGGSGGAGGAAGGGGAAAGGCCPAARPQTTPGAYSRVHVHTPAPAAQQPPPSSSQQQGASPQPPKEPRCAYSACRPPPTLVRRPPPQPHPDSAIGRPSSARSASSKMKGAIPAAGKGHVVPNSSNTPYQTSIAQTYKNAVAAIDMGGGGSPRAGADVFARLYRAAGIKGRAPRKEDTAADVMLSLVQGQTAPRLDYQQAWASPRGTGFPG